MSEGYDLKAAGFSSASQIHLMAESMKRAYADRAKYLGDPDFNRDMPLERLMSKPYSADLRKTINPNKAAKSAVGLPGRTTTSPTTARPR